MKYRIENKTTDTALVYLYDEIGYWGTSAQQFANDLKDITAGRIDLHVNSYGGEVFDGVAIYNAIRQHAATVTVYIDGVAASAASFIAMAGDKVVAARNATIMIHDALTVAMGNAAELRREADLLDKVSENIADIYSQKAGGTVSGWRDAMQKETWYSAAEAFEAGLVDEVTDADSEDDPLAKVAAEFDRMIFARAGGRRQVAERVFPVPLASTVEPTPDSRPDSEPDDGAPGEPDENEDTAPDAPDTPVDDAPETPPDPAPDPLPDPKQEDAGPVPPPHAEFDPDTFRASLATAIPRQQPWEPDQFRLAMQAVALDAPAPRDYTPPQPAAPVATPVVVPDPDPVDESPFDGDLFRAAIHLVANDAPAPPDRSREPEPATEPGFALHPGEFARAIREART